MNTATKIKDLDGFTGEAALFQLSPPLKRTDGWGDEAKEIDTEYVVVSATVAMYSGPETYIFPADADGKVISYGELEGSYRGGLNMEAALEGAGYSVVKAAA
jgi:hypothetical protein